MEDRTQFCSYPGNRHLDHTGLLIAVTLNKIKDIILVCREIKINALYQQVSYLNINTKKTDQIINSNR